MDHPMSNEYGRDPRIPANLAGVDAASVHCHVDTGSHFDVCPLKLRRRVEDKLRCAGLKIDDGDTRKLILNVLAEHVHDQCEDFLRYSVELCLREPASLALRPCQPLQGRVDSWRHQPATGVIFPPYCGCEIKERISAGLERAALKQVDDFVCDWKHVNACGHGQPGQQQQNHCPPEPPPCDQHAPKICIPSVECLDSLVGKRIVGICKNGYISYEDTHDAHFVSHVINVGVGHTCKEKTAVGAPGATLCVSDLFSICRTVGPWCDLGSLNYWGLAFLANPRHVDLSAKKIAHCAKKHVGIFRVCGNNHIHIYHFDDKKEEFVRGSVSCFQEYLAAPDNAMYYGLLP